MIAPSGEQIEIRAEDQQAVVVTVGGGLRSYVVGGRALLDVNTVLLGAGLPFVTPGKNDVTGVLGGGGLEWRTRDGVSVFGAAEAIGFSDQSTVWSARGGFRVAF